MEKIINFLDKNGIEYHYGYDVSLLSSIKLGTKQSLVIFPTNERVLIKLLSFFYSIKVQYLIFGNLSNVLFVQNLEIPIILTTKMTDEFTVDGRLVTVPAGAMLTKVCDYVRKLGLSGFEGLVGIPATIGGAIKNNAGAFGYQISDRLVSIEVFYQGKILNLKRNEIRFGHHYSDLKGFVILKATFLFENKKEYDIMKLYNEFTFKRNASQPSGFSLGSIYKKVNGKSAGFYIERSGLKGKRVGGLVVSSKHSNFFINDKNGSVSDFLRLSAMVESAVLRQFGVTLIPEIEKVENNIDETFSRLPYTL